MKIPSLTDDTNGCRCDDCRNYRAILLYVRHLEKEKGKLKKLIVSKDATIEGLKAPEAMADKIKALDEAYTLLDEEMKKNRLLTHGLEKLEKRLGKLFPAENSRCWNICRSRQCQDCHLFSGLDEGDK